MANAPCAWRPQRWESSGEWPLAELVAAFFRRWARRGCRFVKMNPDMRRVLRRFSWNLHPIRRNIMPKITRDQVKVPADVLADVRDDVRRQLHEGHPWHGPPHAVRVRPEGRAPEQGLLRRGHRHRRCRAGASLQDRRSGRVRRVGWPARPYRAVCRRLPRHQLPGEDELQDQPGQDRRRTTPTRPQLYRPGGRAAPCATPA